jgi:transcriptional regulator with XRE-family HTH domain
MGVKKIRKKMCLTQTQFAKKLGVSFATVNRWENSRHAPSKLVQERISLLTSPYKIISEKAAEYIKDLPDTYRPVSLSQRQLAEVILNEFLQWLGAKDPIGLGLGWKDKQ